MLIAQVSFIRLVDPNVTGLFMIERYIAKHYEWPPCWQLVADVYINELGLSLDDYTPKQIQCAMWPMRLD